MRKPIDFYLTCCLVLANYTFFKSFCLVILIWNICQKTHASLNKRKKSKWHLVTNQPNLEASIVTLRLAKLHLVFFKAMHYF
jgi:hypothetical protein